MGLYRFIRDILIIFVKLFYRVERIGTSNIPKEGSYVFCANHISALDPIFIATVRERDFYFLSKEELFKVPVIGGLFKKLNMIPIKRGAGDLGAMRNSIEVLKEKKALVMFPEGTRSKTGELQEAKDGVSLIVRKSGCNVLPCAVIGKVKLFKKIKVVYGNPLDMSEYMELKDNKVITNVIMEEIKKLIETNK